MYPKSQSRRAKKAHYIITNIIVIKFLNVIIIRIVVIKFIVMIMSAGELRVAQYEKPLEKGHRTTLKERREKVGEDCQTINLSDVT